jgi:glyoxylase-like metal-dependent hydrolase (beta-lactamase superfamily II)
VAIREIGDRVFALHYAFIDQEIGLVLGGSDVLVVDSRSTASQAREIADDVRRITRDPVSIVVNTHFHWDHTWGNHALRPSSAWGHVRTAERMREDQAVLVERLAGSYPDLADEFRSMTIDPPEHTFVDRASIQLGDRVVDLAYHGRGHTDSDISIHVPDANVLFAGDLLENGSPPSFGQGYPIEWADTVARLVPLGTGAVVPGHGEVGDGAFLRDQLAAFQGLADLARDVHAGNRSIEDAIAASLFGPKTPRDAFERALAQLRGELD